ncbi:MAG: recombinase family protein [Oscillospiraceae bacterium]|nr:recombinase family protein [Oscillospiraceae bacterium]
MKNAVIYARYSSDNQTENSVEGQLRECKEYAEKQGITILNTYIDRALSAKTDNRPEFQRMIKDSGKELFDVVLVWKLDRFARNRYDSAHYKHLLAKNNVRVVSATERLSDTPEGMLMESVLEGFAEYYSAELAVKVNRGMTENALKCKFNGGSIPFGYKINDEQYFEIDPVTAPVVREVFTDYANGKTIKTIVNSLNSRGIRNVKGGEMNINRVTYMLKNRRYLGEYSFKDITIENAFEPIISQEIFDKVQDNMRKNKKAPSRLKALDEQYLLTMKLFCGKCGAMMTGESGTGRNNIYRYYKCYHARKRKCDKKTAKKAWIEDLVIFHVMEMLNDEPLINRIVDALFALQGRENPELPLLQKQLAEVERSATNILNAIQDGIYNEFTKKRLDELEERKNQLEVAILQEQIKKPLLSKEDIRFWVCRWREVNIEDWEEKQKLVDIFVNSVYIYDNKIVLVLNCKDGERTITLDEVNAGIEKCPVDSGLGGSSASLIGAPNFGLKHSVSSRFALFKPNNHCSQTFQIDF